MDLDLKQLISISDSLSDFESAYSYEQLISSGHTGISYLCKDSPWSDWVVKIIPRKEYEVKEKVRINKFRFLSHPNLARLKDVYEDVNHIYFVSEPVLGGTLALRLSAAELYSEKVIAAYICQVLSAVEYLHETDTVHGNLKVENILVKDEGEGHTVKIADSSMLAVVKLLSLKNSVLSSSVFNAPEVLLGKDHIDKSDMWAIGVFTYLLMCGEEPYIGASEEETFKRAIKSDLDFNSPHWGFVSFNCKDFIRKLLAFDPDDRATAKEALKHLWISGNGSKDEHLRDVQEDLKIYLTDREEKRHITTFSLPEVEEVLRKRQEEKAEEEKEQFQLAEEELELDIEQRDTISKADDGEFDGRVVNDSDELNLSWGENAKTDVPEESLIKEE